MTPPVQPPMSSPTEAVRRAIGLLASDPAAAQAEARALLAADPDHVDARIVLATALRLSGEGDQALAVIDPLAAAWPQSWIIQFELGQSRLANGASRAAVGPLTAAVRLNPRLVVGWRLLGDIALAAGRTTASDEAYGHMLAALITDGRLQGAARAMAAGRLEAADQSLRAQLRQTPDLIAGQHLLGEICRRSGRLAEAEALLAQVVARAPGFLQARQGYALVLLAVDKCPRALVEIDGVLVAAPDDNRSRMIKAAVHSAMGEFAQAAAVTADVLTVFPDQPQAWLVYGNGLRTLGRTAEAIEAFQRCLALDGDFTEAYWSLSNLKTYSFSDEDCALMQARLASGALDANARSHLDFTLGKVAEDAGRYAEAFDHYDRANRAQKGLRGYRAAQTSAYVDRAIGLFTADFFTARAGWGEPAPDPIFIVGLPRSGSTLVEQILSSHPAVEGTRELGDIQVLADWVGGPRVDGERPGYPGQMATLPADLCAKLGRDYLDWTRMHRRQGRARFTDKAPWNFLHTGLIQLILPKARIIDVRRHPLGGCLSAWRQHFGQGFDFAYDLEDLGRYYADYVRLMAHFDQVLPGRVHRVIYESLVSDTESEIRRLLAYLGLPFDEACLRFFDNPRAVATPSSQQVRRPIFTEGVDQWRRFEPWLDPLKAALGPVLEAYPAVPRFQSTG